MTTCEVASCKLGTLWFKNQRFTNLAKRLELDPAFMVKSYSRSAAGRHEISTQDLRPGPVLHTTVEYLLGRVAQNSGRPWAEVYDFIFDRLRAVRQDMTIQQMNGSGAITLLESTVRFYIYAGYRLCEEPIDRFDPKINAQHTQECLKQLLSLYASCNSSTENRAEFESLYLLFNLDQKEALQHYYELPSYIRNEELLKQTYNICLAYYLQNYIKVLKGMKSELFTQRPLLLCAFHRNLTHLQMNALRIMAHGFSSNVLEYPVNHLADQLWFDETAVCVSVCELCGLQVRRQEMVVFLKTAFREPEKKIEPVHISGIDSLLCQRPLCKLLLQKDKPIEICVLQKMTDDSCEFPKPVLPRGVFTENSQSKPQSGRGRGRGRGGGRKGQEEKYSMIKGQSGRTCQGQVSGVNLGYESENRTKMCENSSENESQGSKNYVNSLVKNEAIQTVLRKSEDVRYAGESWEEELFTVEDMKAPTS